MGESAIVFTEYRDTLAHVQRTLARTSPGLGVAGVIHGGLTREERRKVLDDFQNRRVTILLATDAGGEGLNLHHTCRVVINLELPWNPMRLEQRVGRVDRIGQSRRVHAFNLIARDTGELRSSTTSRRVSTSQGRTSASPTRSNPRPRRPRRPGSSAS